MISEKLLTFGQTCYQGLVKGAILCFRNPYFYFWHGESTYTASQKSKDLNKILLLLQDLEQDGAPEHLFEGIRVKEKECK